MYVVRNLLKTFLPNLYYINKDLIKHLRWSFCKNNWWLKPLTDFSKDLSQLLDLALNTKSQFYPLRSTLTNKTNVIPSWTKTFKKNFFPYCINEWNNLNAEVRNVKSIKFFKKMIITENKENFLFSVYDRLAGEKRLTHLRLQFSHLNEHKFRHGFGDIVSPLCGCNVEIGDTEHFRLRCHFSSIQRIDWTLQ